MRDLKKAFIVLLVIVFFLVWADAIRRHHRATTEVREALQSVLEEYEVQQGKLAMCRDVLNAHLARECPNGG